jgi:hypothetical protein
MLAYPYPSPQLHPPLHQDFILRMTTGFGTKYVEFQIAFLLVLLTVYWVVRMHLHRVKRVKLWIADCITNVYLHFVWLLNVLEEWLFKYLEFYLCRTFCHTDVACLVRNSRHSLSKDSRWFILFMYTLFYL